MRFSCWTGGTTAQVCRLPRRGETDARFKSLLKHRVGGGAAPAMHPSSASADFTDTAILRLCFGRAVFVCQVLFLLDWGARLRRSVGCPEGARQTRVSNRCSSIAWAARPPQRCTPVQQVQQRRPPPAAETGRSCWGCGQQDMRPAQGPK